MAIEFNSLDDKMSYARYIFCGITHRGAGYRNPIEEFIDFINKRIGGKSDRQLANLVSNIITGTNCEISFYDIKDFCENLDSISYDGRVWMLGDYTVEEQAKQKYTNDVYADLDEDLMAEAMEMFQDNFREFATTIGHPELYENYEKSGRFDNRQIEAAIKSASNEGYLFYRDGKFVVCFGNLPSYREI
mgnify:CR=1 FL=1